MYDYAYYKEAFAGQSMPFAYLDLDLLTENMKQVVANRGGKRIRLASKSLRSVEVLRRILATDSCFQGLMCYTAREAVYLAEQGFTDLLLGYPIWHREDLAAVAQATKVGAQITLMIDCLEQVQQVERIAKEHEVCLPLCLDIDMSLALPGLHFGVWRTSLQKPEQARGIVEQILASPHLKLDGVMGYEAQIAGVGDNYQGKRAKNSIVRLLKRRSEKLVAERRAAFVAMIHELGGELRFVNGGGTGSLSTTQREEIVTEITVGSGFYAPTLFDNFQAFRYRPAAGYAIEIVRRPTTALYTCSGGGYIASGAVGLDKQPQPYLPVGARLDGLEGAGEVQTPIHYSGSIKLEMGDPIFMRHAKAGELCERFTHLLLVEGGKVVDKVTTYRGDGKCFL